MALKSSRGIRVCRGLCPRISFAVGSDTQEPAHWFSGELQGGEVHCSWVQSKTPVERNNLVKCLIFKGKFKKF
jgi:hypothetical protein